MKEKKMKELNTIHTGTNVVFNGIFIIYSLLCIMPIILIFMVSISAQVVLIDQGYTFFPKQFSFESYKYIFQDSTQIVDAYKVTILQTILGTLISIAMTMLYAYPLSRQSFKYRNGFAFFIFFTMLFQGGLVPWYILYTRYLHIQNTLMALIMPGFVSAFNVLIMRTYFRDNLPNEILEAAKVDGAGEFYMFLRIVIPLSTPVIATIGLFQTLYYWNDWYNCLLFIQNPHLYDLQFTLYEALQTVENLSSSRVSSQVDVSAVKVPSETLRMAMAIVSIGPIILAYPFFQKYFIKGLTIGAVKG